MIDVENMSEAGRKAAERAARRRAASSSVYAADLRAENEDDDGYDPYSDYMDALARDTHEALEEDPWR